MLYIDTNLFGMRAAALSDWVSDPHRVREINEIDTFTFTTYPGSALYSNNVPKATYVKVYDDVSKEVIFRGRTVSVKNSISDNTSKEVTCEGEVGYLKDSFVHGLKFAQGTPVFVVIQMLIINHNYFVDDARKFSTNIIVDDMADLTDNETYFIPEDVDLDCVTTYEAFKTLIDMMKWEFQVIHNTSSSHQYPRVIHIARYFGYKARLPLALGINVSSIEQSLNTDELVTRVFPVGGVGYDERRLTLIDYNSPCPVEFGDDGSVITNPTTGMYAKMYIDNETLVNKWGVYPGIATFDDIVANTPEELPAKRQLLRLFGILYARSLSDVNEEISITAHDLYSTGYTGEPIELFNFYPVVDPVSGLNGLARLKKVDENYDDILNSSLEFDIKRIDKNSEVK